MEPNVSRPKIYKRIDIDPVDWMKVYEGRSGKLIFMDPPKFKVGTLLSLYAYNRQNGTRLTALPKLNVEVVEMKTLKDNAERVEYEISIKRES